MIEDKRRKKKKRKKVDRRNPKAEDVVRIRTGEIDGK